MKLVALLILSVFAAFGKGDDMMMKITEGCKQSTGATDDDMEKFMKHAVAENQVQKCLFLCFMTGIGVVSELKTVLL